MATSSSSSPAPATSQEEKCCPVFQPEKWDRKTFIWNEKSFIMESIPTFFHIPLPPMISHAVSQMWELALKANKIEADETETLLLFRDPTAFRSELYLSVTGLVPGAKNASISGTFEARVFDGPYNSVPKFIKEMDQYLSEKGKKAKDYYVHYAYCPKCAKKFGKNYMILFAQV